MPMVLNFSRPLYEGMLVDILVVLFSFLGVVWNKQHPLWRRKYHLYSAETLCLAASVVSFTETRLYENQKASTTILASLISHFFFMLTTGPSVSSQETNIYALIICALRAYRLLTMHAIPSPLLFGSATAHLFCSWRALGIGAQKQVCSHINGIFAVKGFTTLKSFFKEAKLTLKDFTDLEFEAEFSQKCHGMKLNHTQRLFIARTIISSEWKHIVGIVVSKTVNDLLLYGKQAIFFSILAIISNDNSKLDTAAYSQLAVLILLWQASVLVNYLDQYIMKVQKGLLNRISWQLTSQALELYLCSHCEPIDLNKMDMCVRNLIKVVSYAISLQSKAISQFFWIWLIADKVGWRVILPVISTAIHYLLSQTIKTKIKTLRETHTQKVEPMFTRSFESIGQNLRAIKFYAWDSHFSNVSTEWDLDGTKYSPPMFWRALDYVFDAIGVATSQIGAIFALYGYIYTAKGVTYSEITMLIWCISSLSNFTLSMAYFSGYYINYQDSSEFFMKLVKPKDLQFIQYQPADSKDKGGPVVELCECIFSWGDGKFSLAPITTRIEPGDFVAVIGSIGSGKSSLLQGLCGEMPISGGHGLVRGQIGYVSQKPAIFNSTLRENILMGAAYDEKRFEQVIQASALSADIQQLADGDMTEIGSNGVNLSGGQKVRLALARALYLQADIYIFDDILSAVDAQVERFIVENVLSANGLIGDKMRILATHAEHVVPLCDKLITLVNGSATIQAQTAAAVLASTDSLLPTIVEKHAQHKDLSIDSIAEKPTMAQSAPSSSSSSSSFTIDPELEKSIPLATKLWWFIKASGYLPVGLVLSIHIIDMYLLYKADTLRTQLMINDNPDTMSQTLISFLTMQAVVQIVRHQTEATLNVLSRHLWSKRVFEILRLKMVASLLAMPLSLSEGLSYSTIYNVFVYNRFNLCFSGPDALRNNAAYYLLTTTSLVLQLTRLAPILVIPCAFFAAIAVLMKFLYEPVSTSFRDFNRNHIYKQLNNYKEIIKSNRLLLNAHSKAQLYLSMLQTYMAKKIQYDSLVDLVNSSCTLLMQIIYQLINITVLSFHMWQRFYASKHVSAGRVEASIYLLTATFSITYGVSYIEYMLRRHIEYLTRCYIYCEKLEKEAPAVVPDSRPPAQWPSHGVVEFAKYSMRYRSTYDLVLRELTFATRGGERLGIVGRTGAGKSSIAYALMRMVEAASGQIIVDGIDISTIGVQDLRSRIAIIPQDPPLFRGTVRDNLDPGHEYTDDRIWAAINAVQIADILARPTDKYSKQTDFKNESKGPWVEGVGLAKWVESGGKNFSVGQRQLLSLCRALLWRRKIVLFDEATANVDSKTDRIIQKVVREEFRDCTVLTIAHRLDTVMDSDRILVMDQGRVAEFDTPENLLANRESHFTQLVESMKLAHNTS